MMYYTLHLDHAHIGIRTPQLGQSMPWVFVLGIVTTIVGVFGPASPIWWLGWLLPIGALVMIVGMGYHGARDPMKGLVELRIYPARTEVSIGRARFEVQPGRDRITVEATRGGHVLRFSGETERTVRVLLDAAQATWLAEVLAQMAQHGAARIGDGAQEVPPGLSALRRSAPKQAGEDRQRHDEHCCGGDHIT